jgi:hypothetical protein
MQEVQGGIIGSGLIVMLIGLTGIIQPILHTISPITIAANIGVLVSNTLFLGGRGAWRGHRGGWGTEEGAPANRPSASLLWLPGSVCCCVLPCVFVLRDRSGIVRVYRQPPHQSLLDAVVCGYGVCLRLCCRAWRCTM